MRHAWALLAVFLGSQAGGPEWIWTAKESRAGERAYFRKTFETGALAEATAVTACDNHMTLYINGKEVLRHGEWSHPVRVDALKWFREGKNVIAVEARNDDGAAGFFLRLHLKTAGGKNQAILTNAGWKASASASAGWEKVDFDASGWKPAVSLGEVGTAPWGNVLSGVGGGVSATPPDKVKVRPGFKLELLYSVPKATEGSWVSLTTDPKGRLIVSDERNQGLFRVTPEDGGVKIEKIDVPLSGAQGLLWAFDSLYVNVNGRNSGLWRVTDSDRDDRLDKVESLLPLKGAGEHGPHAVVLTENRKALYVVAGNHTDPPDGITASRISTNWDEDLLLPRQWDAQGHARGRMAPGGWVLRVSPDGKEREVYSLGYRNEYDVALNIHGEMFTYDSDMEWDLGMPWYRPTRICHVVSGSEFGWRSGTGKWPAYYADSLPATADIGPGSPTGVVSGLGARFPAKYQEAIYVLDWTYGTIWAMHLKPQGASYTAEVEEFVSGTPLPVTDAAIGMDGAMYFAIGGRGTQSGLYRLSYTGSESTAPVAAREDAGSAARALRRSLEVFHGRRDPKAVDAAWPHLGSPDRFLRYAARLAVESQPVESWQGRALRLEEPQALATAMVALARQGTRDAQPALLSALGRLDLGRLPEAVLLEVLRAYELAFIRLGRPAEDDRKRAIERLDAIYPSASDPANAELVQLLVYLQAPNVVPKTLKLMAQAKPTPRPDWVTVLDRNRGYGGVVEKMFQKMPPLQKIHYAFVLRNLPVGWTLEERRSYFEFLNELAEGYSGGASFKGFVRNMKSDAISNCSPAERQALGPLAVDKPRPPIKLADLPKPKGPGREWTMDDLVALTGGGLRKRSYENGKRAFRAAQCVACHRFDGEGGDSGPDLTGVSGRFSLSDLLESTVDPNKVISDQYQATIFRTKDDNVVAGRVVEEKDGKIHVVTDLLKPEQVTVIPKSSVAESKPSAVSPMPAGLLNPLGPDEVLDLVAYLLSAGNARHAMFR